MTNGCACGHGWSWHIEWVTTWNWGGEDFVNKKVPCQYPYCKCDGLTARPKEDDTATYFKPEQIKLNEELKESHQSSIVIDKDFHELFCTVLKQETNRECDCEGTTSEIRRKK